MSDEEDLLPTPSGLDGGQKSRGGDRRDEPLLGGVVGELLPTPTATDSKAGGSRNAPGSAAHPGVSLSDVMAMGDSRGRRTSGSSRGSARSGSPSRPSGSSASDRSSSTRDVDGSSSDGGRLFDVGPTSATSGLLPTPNAGNFNDGQTTEVWRARRARERAKRYNGNGGATPIEGAVA